MLRSYLQTRSSLLRSAFFSTTPKPPTLETWPDGTQKQFQGKHAWKNWINYNTDHNNLTDQLNRLRHFFWEVDTRGKLWRLEIDQLDAQGRVVGLPRRTGQMKEPQILDFFFPQLKRNESNMYPEDFPFVVQRAHEMYFCKATWWDASTSLQHQSYPLVFNNFVQKTKMGETPDVHYLQHSCPGSGHVVRRVDTVFDPSTLRTDAHGRLFHPIASATKVSTSGNVKKLNDELRWGLLESVLVQTIATEVGEMTFDAALQETSLTWEGVAFPVVGMDGSGT